MRRLGTWGILVAAIVLFPSFVYAQASIAGVVKDASGAVLPGVSVEAASPVLIEKVRTVVTDGTGQYRIENLRPGTYSITFTLAGFNTVMREGVQLEGSFTATINADMKVGGVEETITITGESPVVDVQNVTQQRVVGQEVIAELPTGKSDRALGALVPGVVGGQDAGGALTNQQGNISIHGGSSGTIMQGGVAITSGFGTNGNSNALPNMAGFAEITFDTSAGSVEMPTGGIRINFVPRDGGNVFNGTFFTSFANHSTQGNNYTDELRRAGLAAPSTLDRMWEANPGLGGPIVKNKLWVYGTYRYFITALAPSGAVFNLNANKPDVWTYSPASGKQPSNESTYKDLTTRVTWQATPRNKIAATITHQPQCYCAETIAATVAPDAAVNRATKIWNPLFEWTSPLTNRVLIETSMLPRRSQYTTRRLTPFTNPNMVSVVDQALGNLVYRAPQGTNNAPAPFRDTQYLTSFYRANVSYITGAHAFKIGMNWGNSSDPTTAFPATLPYNFRFNNGVPNQITVFSTPSDVEFNSDVDMGIYGQDKWTLGRLALNYGLRYDHYKTSYHAQHLGPGPLVPNRNIDLPKTRGVAWNDLSFRSGAAYDLRGNGKTTLKVTLNKYVAGVGDGGPFGLALAPANLIVQTTTRNWTDGNRNYIPDCDLKNPALQDNLASGGDLCGAFANPTFGLPARGSSYDPDTLSGWGKRGFDYEFSTNMQHEPFARTSLNLGYYRRWFGNFIVTDDRAVSAADFQQFSLTAPSTDARLPTQGQTINGLFNLVPAAFGRASDNYVTFAKSYGKQIQHWNGFDITLNARPRPTLTLQGGMSTGRTSTDNCGVAAKVPEVLLVGNVWTPLQYCHQETRFLTQVKWVGSYTVPKIDVLVSAVLQNVPGPVILANYNAPNAVVQPSLGRPLSGNAANITVALLSPGTLYGSRSNVMDMRLAKILRVDRKKMSVNLDFYNILNNNTPTTLNSTFGGATPWQAPQVIPLSRYAKISAQIDF